MAAARIQRHTILTWFLRNYEPARGTLFGFKEASLQEPKPSAHDGSARYDGSTSHDAPGGPGFRIGGWDQAPWSDGGPADRFLRAEFGDAASEDMLSDLASALPGVWMLRTDPLPPASGADVAELRSALLRLLDGFDEGIRELPTPSRGRWDNNPPERLPDEFAAIEPEERHDVLRATADMRLAVASEDYSKVTALWEAVQSPLLRVAAYAARKLDLTVNAAMGVLGVGLGTTGLVKLLIAFGVLEQAEAISAILKALHVR